MPAARKPAHKVGDTAEVKEGAAVRRPDGTEVTVTGGLYVYSQPGTYVVGDEEVEVKP